MERHRLTADLAFDALTAASMNTNTKLRAVADELVTTGVFDPQYLAGPTGGQAEPTATSDGSP